jgi:hypothetical protein
MGALVMLLVLLVMAGTGWKWGVDSRYDRDTADRYWWPNS